jgi:heme/copper-type cytochrome/quinol oxidase subunit 3
MGLWLLLASLTMLFGASLVGYMIVRLRAPEAAIVAGGHLPGGLWISTAILVLVSVLLAVAESSLKNARQQRAARMLTAALASSVAFLALQVSNWMRLAADNVTPEQSIVVWGFYTLTFLHALHVVAGLVPLTFVALRLSRGRYESGDSEPVHLVGLYWHFLLATWVAIFISLMI